MSANEVEQAYGGIEAIPTTFLIDRQNVIRKRFVGTQPRGTLEQALLPLLYGRLACQRIQGQLILRWPTNVGAATLQSTTNPAAPSWSAWPTASTVVNGTNTVTITLSEPARHFRLRMPY
jgi:hypothetical protein